MADKTCNDCGLPIVDSRCYAMGDGRVYHAGMNECIKLLRAELVKQRESLDIAIRNVKNLTDANQDLRDEIEQLKTEGGDNECA